MDKGRVFTLSQIAQHKSKKDCWIVIKGIVVNVTKFLEDHPGGEEVLMESAGKDATKEFDAIGHSKAAEALVLKYQVGYLQGHKFIQEDLVEVANGDLPENMTKKMKAFVIKEDPASKYTFGAFLEFFVPFLVASSYFAYRMLH